ncbi:MAG: glycosyltransferase family 4 protein [Pseudomonadota bacterium]
MEPQDTQKPAEDRVPRIAYLTGNFPEVSLTFILREIEALRDLGADVLTCAIRQTPAEQHPGPSEKRAAATTFYVLRAARNPLRLLACQSRLFHAPGRYFGALRLALATRGPGASGLMRQMVYFLEATVLARYLERKRVDCIHNHFIAGSATVSMLTSEMTGIPFSFTLHGPADLFEPVKWALREKTKRARFVSTISHFARSQIMFHSDPADWDKIKIIHCGINPSAYAPRAEPRDDDEIRLLFVGRLAPVKGIDMLLEALGMLVRDLPHLRLTIVGDGPERKRLEAVAAPLGEHVSFVGYKSQAEVAELMRATDIFVLPSFAEGVPVVLMEAMASEVPVIATTVAGVGELVEDGVHGHLVHPGDAAPLGEKIAALASDPATRQRMGKAGRTKVADAFNIHTEAARLLDLFAETPER